MYEHFIIFSIWMRSKIGMGVILANKNTHDNMCTSEVCRTHQGREPLGILCLQQLNMHSYMDPPLNICDTTATNPRAPAAPAASFY